MAYQQYVKYKDIGIAVNGVEIFKGAVNAPLVNDTVKNWMASHLYGSDALIYIRDEPNINPNFANLEVAYSEASDQIKGNWIADRLQDNGDYIEYYNTVVGDICKIRITRTSGTSTYIDAKFSIIYLGRTIAENSARTIWQLDSGTTCVIMLMPLLDVDARMATFFVGFRTASFPAHWRDSWNIDHRPVFYQADYTNGVGQAIYTIFRGYDSGGGGGGDPYVPDDYDEPVGGNDDPDDSSDTITEDALPTIGATVSGLCTAYVPTISQMQALANRLVDPTWYQALGNTVLDISDAVIGLQVLPFVVPSTLSTKQWKLNFLGISLPSGVYLNKATQQFHEISCGTIHVTPYWNNCLDYNPYTQISVFLPFCGFFELDTDDVMDHDLEIKYRVDIMSGACLATIKVDGSIMYQFAGECGNQIPVSSVSFDNFLQSAMQLAITTASGSIGLAAAGASATMQKEKIAMSEMNASDKQFATDEVNSDLNFKKSQNGVGLLAATAGAVISAKGQYKHAGCIAGSPGFLGVRKPYLIIKRPKQIMPSLYGDFRGYPTNTVMKLSDCHGYTEVDSIRLNIPNATVDEIYECETLLKEGVVFD